MKLHLPVLLRRAIVALMAAAPAVLPASAYSSSATGALLPDDEIITLSLSEDEEEKEEDEWLKWLSSGIESSASFASASGSSVDDMSAAARVSGTHYMVDGIVLNSSKSGIDLNKSVNFYDTSKAYYLYADDDGNILKSDNLYKSLFAAYKQAGYSFDFLGNLKSLLSTSTTSSTYKSYSALRTAIQKDTKFINALLDDHSTCWYQATSNIVQHWLDKYGVFSHSASSMPYGHNYSVELVDDFEGVASLDVASYFYKYWQDTGGNSEGIEWYLRGSNKEGFKWDSKSDRKMTGGGGFFSVYYPTRDDHTYMHFGFSRINSHVYSSTANTLGAYADNTSKQGLSNLVKAAFSYSSTSSTYFSSPLLMVYWHFGRTDYERGGKTWYVVDGGHAITCYGYSVGSDGLVNCLWIADNQDGPTYGLTPYTLTYLNLGSDKYEYVVNYDKDMYGYYATSTLRGWHVALSSEMSDYYTPILGSLTGIYTPTSLVKMHEEYTDPDNPQVWNGSKSGGMWTGNEVAYNADELPTTATGWDVYCATGASYGKTYFPTYYTAGRDVKFDDHSTNKKVVLNATGKTITAGDLIVDTSSEYVFTTNNGTSLKVGSLTKSGSGTAKIAGVQVSFSNATLSSGTLALSSSSKLSGSSFSVSKGGVLFSSGKNTLTLTGNLVVNQGGMLKVDSDSSGAFTLGVSKLQFASGAIFNMVLDSSNVTTPLLSLTGALTLGSGTVFQYNTDFNFTEGATYRLVDVDGFSASTLSNVTISGGTLAYENGYIVFKPTASYSWSSGNGTWSPSMWQGKSLKTAGKDVLFSSTGTSSNTVTVSQTVMPGSVSIADGKWSFTSSTTTPGAIDVQNGVVISGDSVVSSSMVFGGSSLQLLDTAQLTYALKNTQTEQSLKLTSKGKLTLSGSTTSAALTVKDIQELTGDVVLNGADLILDLSKDTTIAGDISSSNTSSQLALSNDSDSPISYNFTGNVNVAGGIEVGYRGDSSTTTMKYSSTTTMKWNGNLSNRVSLSDLGILELCGEAEISGKIQGNGTLRVASDAEVLFLATSGAPSFANTLSLDIAGFAQIGGLQSGGITGTYASQVNVSGSLYVVQETSWEGSPLYAPALSLANGGQYAIYVRRPTTYSAIEVAEHVMKDVYVSSGSAALARYESSAYVPYGTSIQLQKLRGSGNISLAGCAFGSLTVYELADNAATSFTGNIAVIDNGVDKNGVTNCYHLTSAELGKGSYRLVALEVRGDDAADGRAALGIAGDVTLKGLTSSSSSTYLYSGHMKKDAKTEKTLAPESLVVDEVQRLILNVDSGKSYSFAGSVLGSLNIVKSGQGTQTFSGEFGGFTGNVGVSAGSLVINDSFTANQLIMSSGTRLSSNGTINAGAALMEGGQLSANTLNLQKGSYSGQNILTADSITLSGVKIQISSAHASSPALTLNALSTSARMSISGISCSLASGLADGEYSLLRYDSRFLNGALAGVENDKSYYDEVGGSGYYTVSGTINGRKYYTLMYHLNTSQRPAADLEWALSSGTWKSGDGASQRAWNTSSADSNFYDGDRVTFSKSGTISISGDVAPASMLVNNTSGTLTFNDGGNGEITGDTGLRKQGSGALSMNLANSYTGGTSIEGGTLITSNSRALGSGTVELKSGTLSLGGSDSSLASALKVTGTGKLESYNASAVSLQKGFELAGGSLSGEKMNVSGGMQLRSGSISNAISADSAVVSGNVSLSGATVFSKGVTLQSGTLTAGGSFQGALVMNGGTFKTTQGFNISSSSGIQLNNGTLQGNFTLTNNGVLDLNKSATLNGSLTLSNGSVDFAKNTKLDVNGTLSITGNTYICVDGAGNRGTYTLATFDSISGNVSLLKLSDDMAVNARLAYSFAVQGSSLIMNVTSAPSDLTWSGGYGIWSPGGGENWQMKTGNGTTLTGQAFYNGDKVTFDGRGTVIVVGDLRPSEVVFSGTQSISLSGEGSIGGSAKVTKKGSGTAVLNQHNTYTGGTYITGGFMMPGGETAFGSGAVYLSGEATLNTGLCRIMNDLYISDGTLVAYDYGGNITVDGFAALGDDTQADQMTLVSGTVYEGSLKDSRLTVQSGNVETLLTGTTSVVKNGSGTAYISQANTYSGGTTLNAGTLVLWNAQSLGTGSVQLNGGTLELQNLAVGNDILAKGGTINGTGAFAGALTVDGALTLKSTFVGTNAEGLVLKSGSISGGALNNASITAKGGTISSAITGNSVLTVENGTVSLSGNNSFTGGVVQNSGTLVANSGTALGAGAVTLNGGTLNMQGFSLANEVEVRGTASLANVDTVTGTLKLTGGKLNSASALTVSGEVEMQSGELASALIGNGSLVKKGSSMATISNSVALSGGIAVEEGQLRATKAFSADVMLNGGRLVLGSAMTMSSGQNICFNGGSLAGSLTTASGAEVELSQSSDMVGNLTLKGGKFISHGHTLTLQGTLTLSASTQIDTDSIGESGDYMLIRYQSISGSTSLLTGIQTDDRVQSSFRLENNALWLSMERVSCQLTWNGGNGTWGASDDTAWILPSSVKSTDKRFHNGDAVSFTTGGEIELTSHVLPASVTVSGSQDLVFSGAYGIGGNTNIVKTGTGSLTLGKNNTFTGTLHIKQGTVNASASDEAPYNNSFGVGNIRLSGGTVDMKNLQFDNKVTVDANSNFMGGGAFSGDLNVTNATLSGDTLQLGSGATATLQAAVINNDLVGAGGVIVNGSTATLAGSSSYKGDTRVTNGILTSSALMEVGNIYLSNATLNATQGLTVSGGAHLRAINNSTVTADVLVGSKGVLDIAGDSTVNGDITVSGGVLQYESGCLRVEGTLTLDGACSFDVSNIKKEGLYTLMIYDGLVGNLDQLEVVYGSSVRTQAELISTDSGLMLSIEGFSRVLNWRSGATGTWQNDGVTTWNYDSTTSTYADGDAVSFTGGGTVTISGEVKPLDVSVSGSSTLTLKGSGSIGGDSVVLRKEGSGSLVMNAANTYAGGTVVSAGTVKAGGVASFGTGDIELQGGQLNLGSYAVSNNIIATGGSLYASAYAGTLSVEGLLQLDGTTRAAGIALKGGTINGASIADTKITIDSGLVYSAVSGASSVLVRGDATLRESNTYTGGTTIESGRLTAGSASSFGSGQVLIQGGQLDMNGCAIRNTVKVQGIADVLNSSSFAGTLVMNGGSLSGDALKVGALELHSGLIENTLRGGSSSAPISITKQGNGDAMLSGDCSQLYATTVINGGTLRVEQNAWASDVIINAGLFAVKDMAFTANTLQFAGGQASGNIQLRQNGHLALGVDAMLAGNLTLDGGKITYGGSALRVEGVLTLASDVQINVASLKEGVYELFSCSDVVGSLDHLKLANDNSRVKYTTRAEAGTVYLEIAEMGGTLSWQTGNGVWADDIPGNWMLGGSGTSFMKGDSVEFAQGGVVTISGDVNPRDISVSGSAEVVFSGSGSIAGDAALVKSGSGTLRVATHNAYTGGTTLNGGTIVVESKYALGVGNITLNGGTLNLGSYDIDNDIVANGGSLSSTVYDGNFTVQGAVALSGSLLGSVRLQNNGSLSGGALQGAHIESYGATINSSISGGSSVYVYDNTTLGGNNTFTGKTYLVSGELSLMSDTALGNSTLMISGGSLNANQHDISQHVTITGDTVLKNIGAIRSDNYVDVSVQNATVSGDALRIYGGSDLVLSNCTIKNDLIGIRESFLRPYVTIDGDTVLGGDCSQFDANVNVYQGDLRIENSTGWCAKISVFSGASITVDHLQVAHGYLDLYGGLVNGHVTVSNGEMLSVVKSSRITGDLSFADGKLWSDLNAVLTVEGSLTLGSGFQVSLTDATPGLHELIRFESLVGDLSDYEIEYLDRNLEGKLVIEGNSLYMEVASLVPVAAADLTWAGNDGVWNSTATNWLDQDGKTVSYTDGMPVHFATGGNVTLSGTLQPGEVEVSGSAALVFTGSGSIAGAGSLQKSGSGSLTMNATNTYTGGTTISAGKVIAGGAKSFGSGDILLSGGALQLGDYAVANNIDAKTASLSGTNYRGTLTVNGNLSLGSNTTAGKVLLKSGGLSSGSLCNTTIEAYGGSLSSALAGRVELIGHDYKFSSVLQNQGTLVMSGSFDASGLTLQSSNASYVSAAGKTGSDGFLKAGSYSVTLVNGGTVQNNGAIIKHGSLGMTLGSNGIATAPGAVDYSTYYLKSAVTEKLSTIVGAAGDKLTSISITGGVLNLDCSTAADLLFDGGNLSLSGNSSISIGDIDFNQKTTLSLNKTYAQGEHLLFSVSGDRITNANNLSLSEVYVGDLEYSLNWSGKNLYLGVTERTSQNLIAAPDMDCWYTTDYSGWWVNERGESAVYHDGDHVLINNNKKLEILDDLKPGSVTFDCSKSVKLFAKYDDCYIGGEARLIKKGLGALSITLANRYSGGTFLEAGTLTAGVADAFGTGAITVTGGILNLANKAVRNDIELAGSAVVKGGKNYAGTFKLSSGQMLKGSQLNVQNSAILAGGIVNGKLSGTGNVAVTGNVFLDSKGSIVTNALTLKEGAVLTTSAKGLSMNAKLSRLFIDDKAKLNLGGKLSAYSLSLASGTLDVIGTKATPITLKGDITLTDGAELLGNGKISGDNLSMKDASKLDVSFSKPQSIAMKGGITLASGSSLNLDGKLSANYLSLQESNIKLDSFKPQSVSVKGAVSLVNKSNMSLHGKLSAASLSLQNGSTLNILGGKPQSASIKGALTIGSGSQLCIHGKLSAGSLSMQNGASIVLSGAKPATIAVKGALTLNSGSSIFLNYDFELGKTYNLISYKGYAQVGNLYSIFGVSAEDCFLADTGKAITLTVTNEWNPQEPEMADVQSGATGAERNPLLVNEPSSPAKRVADAVVQANWAQFDASRAFMGAIAGRSMATLLGEGESAVWASAIGDSSRYSTAGGHAGADTNISGGALGIETKIGQNSLLGMAVGNSWANISPHGFSKIEQDTTHLAVYGQTSWKNGMSLNWSTAYGRSESELQSVEWNQKHLQVDGRVSYARTVGEQADVRVFSGLQYYASDSGSVENAETGSLQNLRAEVGVGASRNSGKWGVYGEMALHQDVVRHNPITDFDGSRTGGMNPGRFGFNITAGATYSLSEHWSLNASYTGEFVENANIHSANVGASYKF